MDSNSRLNELFKKWEEIFSQDKSSFRHDGVINEEYWNKAPKKVLFLCKEPNDPKQNSGDYRKYWNRDKITHKFSRQLGQWAYGILNDFPPHLEAKKEANMKKGLRSIAFMNVKKSGGKGTADEKKLLQHARKHKALIQEQIEIINPEILVGSFSKSYKLWSNVCPGYQESKKWTQYGIWVASWKGIKIVDFYHPSNRYPHVMNYVLLEKILSTPEFRNL